MLKNKDKFLAQVGFYTLVGGLMIYAASRTLDFVQATLPVDKQILGYLYLLATGVGALIWLFVYLTFADGSKQRGIAFAMGILDLVGEMILVYADTVRTAAASGQMVLTASDMSTFITASIAIVGLNIVAGFFFKLFDTAAEAKAHAKDLADSVRDATLKNLGSPEAQAQMVAELSPVLSESIRAEVAAEIHNQAGKHVLSATNLFPGLAHLVAPPDPTQSGEKRG